MVAMFLMMTLFLVVVFLFIWLKFTKTALAFCMSDLAALTTPRKFSTVDVAETNCSLPAMFSLMLNFISFAIFSMRKQLSNQ